MKIGLGEFYFIEFAQWLVAFITIAVCATAIAISQLRGYWAERLKKLELKEPEAQ